MWLSLRVDKNFLELKDSRGSTAKSYALQAEVRSQQFAAQQSSDGLGADSTEALQWRVRPRASSQECQPRVPRIDIAGATKGPCCAGGNEQKSYIPRPRWRNSAGPGSSEEKSYIPAPRGRRSPQRNSQDSLATEFATETNQLPKLQQLQLQQLQQLQAQQQERQQRGGLTNSCRELHRGGLMKRPSASNVSALGSACSSKSSTPLVPTFKSSEITGRQSITQLSEQEQEAREREPEREPGSSSSRNGSHRRDVIRPGNRLEWLERSACHSAGGYGEYDEPSILESAALLATAAVSSMAEQLDGLQKATSQRQAHAEDRLAEVACGHSEHERAAGLAHVGSDCAAPEGPEALEEPDSPEAVDPESIDPFDKITEMW